MPPSLLKEATGGRLPAGRLLDAGDAVVGVGEQLHAELVVAGFGQGRREHRGVGSPGPEAISGWLGLAERAKERLQLRGEQFGLLGGGEVSAARHLGPARDVVGLLRPLAWAGDRVLLREQRDPDWDVDEDRLRGRGIVAAGEVE